MWRTVSPVLVPALWLAMNATPVLADTGDNEVSVAVLGVDCMALPTETELLLIPSATEPASRLIGAATQDNALVMSHNGVDGLRITLTAAPDLMNLPNDISLIMSLADLMSQTCVEDGHSLTDIGFPAPLPPGGGHGDLRWTADATSDATPAGTYAWDILITSTDM